MFIGILRKESLDCDGDLFNRTYNYISLSLTKQKHKKREICICILDNTQGPRQIIFYRTFMDVRIVRT